ncbi:MAG: acetolactate synthase small subunit [Sumerlaeia bacterium]
MATLNGLGPETEHTHIISVLVENHFGVLARISGLFASRGFNIHSLAVGPTHDPTISRITLAVKGDDRVVEQIHKQLNKLVDVIKVQDLTSSGEFIDRELILVKVAVPAARRVEVIQLASAFQAHPIDISQETMTLELVGQQTTIEAFLEILAPYGLLELSRTGRIALSRGPGGMHSSFVKNYQRGEHSTMHSTVQRA